MKYWKVPKQILFTVGKLFNKDNNLFTVVEELSRMNTFSKYINMVCVEEIRSYVHCHPRSEVVTTKSLRSVLSIHTYELLASQVFLLAFR